MSDDRSYEYGKEYARQYMDHMRQEFDELEEAIDESEFWSGFREVITNE